MEHPLGEVSAAGALYLDVQDQPYVAPRPRGDPGQDVRRLRRSIHVYDQLLELLVEEGHLPGLVEVVGEFWYELFKGAVEELLYDLLPVLVVLSLSRDGVRPPLWFRLVVLKELSDEGIPHRGGSLAESLGFEATLRRIPRR